MLKWLIALRWHKNAHIMNVHLIEKITS